MGGFIKFTAKVVGFIAWCCIGYGCDDSDEHNDERKKTIRNETESSSTSTTSSSGCNSVSFKKEKENETYCIANANNQVIKLLEWNALMEEEVNGVKKNMEEEEVVVLDISTNFEEKFEANYYENVVTYCGTIPSEEFDTKTGSNKRRKWRPRKTMGRVLQSMNLVRKMKDKRERCRRYKARFESEICS